jgi:hypothetical protein
MGGNRGPGYQAQWYTMPHTVPRESSYHRRRANDDEAWHHRQMMTKQIRSSKGGGATLDMQATGESVVMIGSVPCKLASEVHINGHRIGGAKTAHTHEGDVMTHKGPSACSGPVANHVHVITAEEREFIGPDYSVCG